MNLFEIMKQAAGDTGFAKLAAEYGLSDEQVAKAAEAFMPAFSAALKRTTADPLGFAELMQRLAVGRWGSALGRPADTAGEEAFEFLFGAPGAARAIAGQAAAFTGLAQEKLAEMLPALTSLVIGGLAKHAGDAHPVLDAWIKQRREGTGPTSSAARGPLDRYEAEQAARGGPIAADVARLQSEMMQAGLTALRAGAAAWTGVMGEATKAEPAGGAAEASAPAARYFAEMFEAGTHVSEAYQREMEATVERLAGAARSGAR